MKDNLKKSLILMAALAFLVGISYSQSRETGALEGTVTDSQDSPLPGVGVTITSPNMIGGAKSQTTDGAGNFRFVLLQPGTYSIEVNLEGFNGQRRDAIRLFSGQTLTVDFTLEIRSLQEEITVRAESPLIDVKDSQMSNTELDAMALNNIVYNQEMYIYSVIDLAPGSEPVYHGATAFGGTARSGNAYMYDGVEISNSVSGNTWAIPDAQSFEEAKVMGLGSNAEYDGFTGVSLSMITKSGGNTYDGMFQAIYQGYDWIGANFDVDEHPLWSEPQEKSFQDIRLGIGGPILKDRLWFYGTVKYLSEGFKTGAANRYHKDQPKYDAKLTFQASPSTRVTALRHFDDWVYDYRYTSVYRPKEAASFEYSHTYIHHVSVFHSFTEKTFLEFKIARVADANYYGGYTGSDPRQVSGHYNDTTGVYSENFAWFYVYPDARNTANAHLSHHADDFIKGSHDFKFGAEWEQVSSEEEYGYNGGFYYVDDVYVGGAFHDYAYEYSYLIGGKGQRVSFFVQDSWKISKNLTINPGIRFNMYRGELVPKTTETLSTEAFAPRIGLTWDIFGDHTTAFKAHYGRYFDKLVTAKWSGAASGINDWAQYEVMPDGTFVELDRVSHANPTLIDKNLGMTHMDQFTLGIERELGKNLSGGVTFVYKTVGDFIRTVNTGSTYDLVSFTYEDENGAEHTGAAYDKTSSSSQDQFLITNPKEGKWDSVIKEPVRNYWGLFFELEKRFSDNWMVGTSYAIYRQTSTYTGRNPSTDPNAQLRALWNGDPVGYIKQNFKIYGTVILPYGFTLSPIIIYRSADRWTKYTRAPVKGSPSYNIEKPGSNKLDDYFNVNFRLEKTFDVQGDLRIGFVVDVYNALNRGQIEGVQERITSSNFGLVDDFNLGRQFRLAFRVYF